MENPSKHSRDTHTMGIMKPTYPKVGMMQSDSERWHNKLLIFLNIRMGLFEYNTEKQMEYNEICWLTEVKRVI